MQQQTDNGDVSVQIVFHHNYGSIWLRFLSRVSTLIEQFCPSLRHTPVLDENGLTYCYDFFTTQ